MSEASAEAANFVEQAFGRPLPPDMKSSIRFNLEKGEEERRGMLKHWKAWLRKIKASGTEERSRKAYAEQPPHVQQVQGHIDFEFIIEVATRLGFAEARHPSFREYWTKGAPMNKEDLPETGYFKPRARPFRTGIRKADSWMQHPIKIPKKPFSFMSQRNLKRAWGDFGKRLKGKRIQLKEIKESEVTSCPIRSFGVEQGDYQILENIKIFNKLRSCWDFRAGNSYCDQVEFMEFWATPEILAAIAAYKAGSADLPTPMKQTKSDVNIDVDVELKDERKHNWDKEKCKKRRRNGMLAYLAKLDKKAYYNQFANREPDAVVYAMWDTDEGKFRYYKVYVLDFGSIHAIWWPIRVAHLNSRILNMMGVTCVVYIDDTVLILTEDMPYEQLELAELFYELCGFEMSTGKREIGMEEGMIKALGYEYVRDADKRVFRVSVPEKKKEEFKELIDKVKADLKKAKVDIKDLERIAGKAVFLASLETVPQQWAIRAMSHWAVKANFYRAMNAGKQETVRRALEEAWRTVDLLKPVLISDDRLLVKIVKLVTDAACPEDPSMGGFCTGEAKARKAWTLEWKKDMKDVEFWKEIVKAHNHIGIWELMAVLINLMFFEEEVKGAKIYFFVDNLGDVRVIAKGTCNCLVSQAIIWVILELMIQFYVRSYYAIYVNTVKNPADLLTRLTVKRLQKLKEFHQKVTGIEEIKEPVTLVEKAVSLVVKKLKDLVKANLPNHGQSSSSKRRSRSDAAKNPRKKAKRKEEEGSSLDARFLSFQRRVSAGGIQRIVNQDQVRNLQEFRSLDKGDVPASG